MTKKNVNGKKNMTQKSDNEIGKFWNKKKVLTDGLNLQRLGGGPSINAE